MSAWMVSDAQISAVISTALKMNLISVKDIKRIGQNIVNANVKSLVTRYGKSEEQNKHKFGYIVTKQICKEQGYKYARCIAYQCCEYSTWKNSKAYMFIDSLCKAIEADLGKTYDQLADEWSEFNWSYKA